MDQMRAVGGVTGDLLDPEVDRQAALAGDRDILVRTRGVTRQPQDRVAMLQQPDTARPRLRLLPRALSSTGSATHSPIIGTCPARKIGQAASSSRARLAAISAGSPPVKDFLLARLARDRRLVAKDVAAELGVSEDSVRRDLRELAAAGLCQRVYGGALAGHASVEVYVLGGRLFRHSMVTCGAAAVEAAQVVHADLFLLGVHREDRGGLTLHGASADRAGRRDHRCIVTG